MRSSFLILMLISLFVISACQEPDPKSNTATSGKLILYVDELYVPIIKSLVDSFKVKVPKTDITIVRMNCREALDKLFQDQVNISTSLDTSASVAAIVGRDLILDERNALAKNGIAIKEYPIANDGLALVAAKNSKLEKTNKENLIKALNIPGMVYNDLDSNKGIEKVNFILNNQNSSSHESIKKQLTNGNNIRAFVQFYSTSDSVINEFSKSNSISIMSWYRAHQDSSKVKTLELGWTDSSNIYPPVIVNQSTLVMGRYPIKQTITGYTFAVSNSSAVGFLAWISKSGISQKYLVSKGLQGLNIKFKLTEPDSWEEVEDMSLLLQK